MALNRLTGPQAAPQYISKALHDLAPNPSVRSFLGGSQPQITNPLPIYFLQLTDIVDEKFPDRAKCTGWRYVVVVDTGKMAAADVDSRSGTFLRLIHGGHAERVLAAVEFAEQLFRDAYQRYELRILEIPSLYNLSLWAKADAGGNSFIALNDHSPTVHIDERFIPRILEAAQRRREMPQSIKGPTN